MWRLAPAQEQQTEASRIARAKWAGRTPFQPVPMPALPPDTYATQPRHMAAGWAWMRPCHSHVTWSSRMWTRNSSAGGVFA